MLGEAGQGLGDLAQDVYESLLGDKALAIATYKGSLKNLFVTIAYQLNIPTENEKGKGLSCDVLKDEILGNVGEDTVLILPEAQRLPTSVRYWLEDCHSQGVTLAMFGTHNPKRDIFLTCGEINLGLPTDNHIREIMREEAIALGLNISDSRLAKLQPLAGRNPLLARKVIRNEKHGLNKEPQHTQYVTVMPIVIAALFAFAVVRFIGMGTNNKGMYIMGGCSLVAAMALRQLGGIKGSRKVLGQ